MFDFIMAHKVELTSLAILLIEFILGKTTLVKSNSVVEVILTIGMKLLGKKS